MAINRKDYQYVRNTLPGYGKGRTDDEGDKIEVEVATKIGDKVKNLLPPLEDNLDIPVFSDNSWFNFQETSKSFSIEHTFLPKTMYVLQILMGDYSSKVWTLHGSVDSSNVCLFNNTDLSKTVQLDIYGITGGYSFRSQYEGGYDEDGNVITGWDNIQNSGDVPAKVFLFKSTIPLLVNEEGVAIAINYATNIITIK